MLLSRFVLTTLVCVLCIQLVELDASPKIWNYTAGDISSRLPKQTALPRSQSPLPVTYTAQSAPYDSLVFVGDVLLARNIEYLMNQHGSDYPYKGVSFDRFSNRPAVVGNFEASIPDVHIPTPAKMIRFSVAELFVPSIAVSGFTHMSLANNHAYDFSEAGYQHTSQTLEQNQLQVFGHPKRVDAHSVEFVELENKVIALIGIHTLDQLPTYSALKEVFNYATPRSDMQIVYVHWGTEYISVHSRRQREAAERFVDAGADVVVGHHPHVVQDIELIRGVPVFYSLGNYIFDQYDSVDTQTGLMLQMEFSSSQPRISLLPVTSVASLSQPRPMEKGAHAAFLSALAKRSDKVLQETIKNGYVLLNPQVASSSKVAIMSL